METFLCQLCGANCKTKLQMGIHLRVTHEEKEVSCKICKAVFQGSKLLYNHMRQHRTKPCKLCWKMISENSLPSHVKNCGGSLEGMLKCNECDYQTNRKQDLQRHDLKHNTVKEDSTVACKECKKTFSKEKYLDQHIQVSHGKKSHECGLCKKPFSTNASLQRHINSAHMSSLIRSSTGFGMFEEVKPVEKKSKFQCGQCEYETNRNKELKRHIQSGHKEKISTDCDTCEYTSLNSANLKRHMSTKHKQEESTSTKYRKLKSLNDNLKTRLKKKEDPVKVFGEEEVKKLLEDCEGSQNDILRIIKWMRNCFGRRQFTPHIKQLIQKHLSRFEELHEAEKVIFIDRDGEDKLSVISKVVECEYVCG